MKKLALFLMAATLYGAGTITQTMSPQGFNNDNQIIEITAVGDASTGSFPATTMLRYNSTLANTDGWSIIAVETDPGSTAPTANWDLTFVDASGLDLLNSQCINRSATATERCSADPIPLYGNVAVTITGNSVNSATITIKVYIVKVTVAKRGGGSSISTPVSVANGGTGATSFTASRCIQSASDGLSLEVAAAACGSGGGAEPFAITATSSTVRTIGTGCVQFSGVDPICLTSAQTVTLSGTASTDQVLAWATPTGFFAGTNGATTITCSAGITCQTGVTDWPTAVAMKALSYLPYTSGAYDTYAAAHYKFSTGGTDGVQSGPSGNATVTLNTTTGVKEIDINPDFDLTGNIITIPATTNTSGNEPTTNCRPGQLFSNTTTSKVRVNWATGTCAFADIGSSSAYPLSDEHTVEIINGAYNGTVTNSVLGAGIYRFRQQDQACSEAYTSCGRLYATSFPSTLGSTVTVRWAFVSGSAGSGNTYWAVNSACWDAGQAIASATPTTVNTVANATIAMPTTSGGVAVGTVSVSTAGCAGKAGTFHVSRLHSNGSDTSTQTHYHVSNMAGYQN